jgi:threonine aldolase
MGGRVASADGATSEDDYSQGGAVTQLETACAALRGKERAVFMPTATLASHPAIPALTGADLRVIVPHESQLLIRHGCLRPDAPPAARHRNRHSCRQCVRPC